MLVACDFKANGTMDHNARTEYTINDARFECIAAVTAEGPNKSICFKSKSTVAAAAAANAPVITPVIAPAAVLRNDDPANALVITPVVAPAAVLRNDDPANAPAITPRSSKPAWSPRWAPSEVT